jgi:hypothetical protein
MPLDGINFYQLFTMSAKAEVTITKAIGALSSCCADCDGSFINKVYGEPSVTNEIYNDKTKIFGVALSTTSTVTFFIEKKNGDTWEEKEEILNQDYGEWRDVGYYTPTNFDVAVGQPKIATYYVEWRELILEWDEGCYRIRIETVALGGGTTTTYSNIYNARFYKDDRADASVVYKWYQDGKIFNNQIDFTGLNIEQQIRVDGKIGYETPELIIDEIEKSNHEFDQIQDRLEENYSFESSLLDYFNTQKILKDVFFGNEIYVIDFNSYSHAPINNVLLKPFAVSEVKETPFNTLAKIKATLKPKTRDNIKRNYY